MWNDVYPKGNQPTMQQVKEYIRLPLWEELCGYLEETYGVQPQMDYSCCSAQPGWNLKYRKSGKSLCVLYPMQGYFIAMVAIGEKEKMEAEAALPLCSEYLQELYPRASGMNNTKWLMMDVTDADIMRDVKMLVSLRVPRKKKKG